MSGLIDNVKLNVDASQANVSGLTKAHTALKNLDLMLQTMQNRIAGLSFKNPFRQSAAQFSSLVKEAGFSGGQGSSVKALARKLGLPNVAEVQQYARDLEKGIQDNIRKIQQKVDRAWQTVPKRGGGYKQVWSDSKGLSEKNYLDQIAKEQARSLFTSPAATSFKSQAAAGKFFEDIGKRMDRPRKDAQAVLNRWLSGEGGMAGGPAKAGTTNAGPIPLSIPPSQIVATLGPGTIPLLVPAGQVGGAAGAAAAAGTAGTKGTKGAGKAAATAAGALRDALAANELELANQIKTLHDKYSTRKKGQLSATPAAGLTGSAEPLELAKLRENASAAIRALVAKSGVEGAQADNALKRAATLDTQTQKARATALKKQADLVTQYADEVARAREAGDKATQKTAQQQLTSARKTLAQQQKVFTGAQKRSLDEEARLGRHALAASTSGAGVLAAGEVGLSDAAYYKVLDKANRDAEAQRLRAERRAARSGPPKEPSALDRLMGGDGRMVTRGLTGFTPVGFAKNLLTVGAWSAAVSALYAPIRLATYSLKQLQEVGLQTARLSQVFRGVGGDAQQLTDDTLSLASATGQSSSDAMQAAVQWSRLGLTRKQVNEAVRVSLMAANVAEMTAGESTEHLSAVTAVYGLRVSELEGVLGMLNNTSNTARVTNKDLLTGLSNVAAVGKEAGFSLAELQGIIGGGVEISGQTGSRMGNALKTILSRMSRPEIQEYMRNLNPRGAGGVEMGTPEGGEKSRAEALRELFVVYQSVNKEERTNMAVRLAGAHQANRFSAIMDSYLRGQQLAIDSQLNLNSAQSENAKIIATLKNQVAGLKAEWDRFVVGSGLGQYFSDLARFGKDALRLMNPGMGGKGPDYSKMTDAQLRAGANKYGILSSFINPRSEERRELTRRWFNERTDKGKSTSFWSALGVNPYDKYGKEQLDLRTWAAMRAETPYERGEGEFRNKVQQAAMRAAARGDQARLFDTVRRVIETGLPENAQRAATFIGKNLPQNLQGAFREAGADRGAQVAVLTEARKQALAAQAAAAKDAADAAAARTAGNKTAQTRAKMQIATLEANPPPRGRWRTPTPEEENAHAAALAKAKNDLESLKADEEGIAAAANKYADALEQVAEDDHQRKVQNQETLNILQQQEDSLQSLARIGGMFPASTAVGRGLVERGIIAAQLAELEAQSKRMLAPGGTALFSGEMIAQNAQQRRELRARDASLGSVGMTLRQQSEDSFNRGAARGQRGMIAADFGEDPTDKLLRQYEAAARRIDQIRAQPNPDLEQRGELLQLEKQLQENINQLKERGASIEQQINQLLVDRGREFRQSFVGAGPSEMLRKLAAFRTAFDDRGNLRKTSQGAFFAMAPGMRSDFGQLNPQFDPQMQDLTREKRRWQRTAGSVDLDEIEKRNAVRNAGDNAAMLGKLGGAAAALTPTLDAAASAMNQLGSSASATARAVVDLGVAVMTLRDQITTGNGSGATAPTAPTGHSGQFGGAGAGRGWTGPRGD